MKNFFLMLEIQEIEAWSASATTQNFCNYRQSDVYAHFMQRLTNCVE